MQLIKRKNLEKLIRADPFQRDYSTKNYYKPIIRYFFLEKIKLGLQLLAQKKYENLLDIGFGGGIILPELSKYAQNIIGIDVHKNIETVKEIIKDENLSNVNLQYGNILKLPFADNYFATIWCLSTLEFIQDYSLALGEIKRVAQKDATIIIGFPLTNKITDLAYSLIGFKNKDEHQNSQKELMSEIEKNFKIVQDRYFPNWLPKSLAMFYVVKVKKF